jgi:hypothetical protein
MRAIFHSASGKSLFERYGARTYVVRVETFAAERALEPEDERLIELEGCLAVAKGPIPLVLRELIAAGYFWALFERWLEEPRRRWKIDPEERTLAARSLVERNNISTEEAALHLELAAVKSGFEDLVPPRDRTMRERLAAVRDAQIESFLDAFGGPARLRAALPGGDLAAVEWLAECFDWGVAIGLRRKLYARDPKRAEQMLSPA